MHLALVCFGVGSGIVGCRYRSLDKERGLSTEGNKKDLVRRYQAWLKKNQISQRER